jgi:hypothetical protein
LCCNLQLYITIFNHRDIQDVEGGYLLITLLSRESGEGYPLPLLSRGKGCDIHQLFSGGRGAGYF